MQQSVSLWYPLLCVHLFCFCSEHSSVKYKMSLVDEQSFYVTGWKQPFQPTSIRLMSVVITHDLRLHLIQTVSPLLKLYFKYSQLEGGPGRIQGVWLLVNKNNVLLCSDVEQTSLHPSKGVVHIKLGVEQQLWHWPFWDKMKLIKSFLLRTTI